MRDIHSPFVPRAAGNSPRQWVAAAIVLFGMIGLGGCATDRSVINQANEVHQGLEPAVIEDPQLANYLQKVGNRVINAAKKMDSKEYGPDSHRSEDSKWMFTKDMKFHFVNSKTLNAFTTGGEHMYIYTELFQQCKSEDELAAVMAHEYGHVYARHVQKGMDRQYATLGVAAAAGLGGAALGGKDHALEYGTAFGGAALAAGQFVGMGFTRKDEAEADELGFDFYTRAGWDPNKFADFFQHMIDAGYDKTPAIASDHPTLASRVQIAKEEVKKLPPEAKKWRKAPVADAAEFKSLQARATKVGKTMPNDATLAGAQELLNAFPNCITPADQPGQAEARKVVLDTADQKAANKVPKKK